MRKVEGSIARCFIHYASMSGYGTELSCIALVCHRNVGVACSKRRGARSREAVSRRYTAHLA